MDLTASRKALNTFTQKPPVSCPVPAELEGPGQIYLQWPFLTLLEMWTSLQTHSCSPASCFLLLNPWLPCPSSRAGHADLLAGYLANRPAVLAAGSHTSDGSSGQAAGTVTAVGHIGLGLGGVFLGSRVVFGPLIKGFWDFCVAL